MIEQHTLDQLRTQHIAPQNLFIAGKWQEAEQGDHLTVTSPIDGKTLTTIASAAHRDVDLAVTAARHSFNAQKWSREKPQVRKHKLLKWADLIEAQALEITVLGVRDNGTELSMAYKAEAVACANCIRYYAESIDKLAGEITPTHSKQLGLIHRVPIGVVAAIIPWNFPLSIGAWKIAPALSVGNSVVLKPSEQASLAWLAVAALANEADIPEGVFNVITGKGSLVGKALGLHQDVDILTFTGGEVVAKKLHQYAAQSNVKTLYLELGGKSPNIIFEDCGDLHNVVDSSVKAIFRNNGQVCVAASRLLVQAPLYEEVKRLLLQLTKKLRIGDPLNLKNHIGAINNAHQLQSNLDFINVAHKEGLDLLTGGQQILNDSGGYYMQPTIFTDVPSTSQLFQNEIFGPLLTVTPFEDEQHAIQLANSTRYGLAAGVWTQDISRTHRLLLEIDSGVVHVNCWGGTDMTAPMGGMKQSGNGYDRSLLAVHKFCHYKTGWIAINEPNA